MCQIPIIELNLVSSDFKDATFSIILVRRFTLDNCFLQKPAKNVLRL